MRLGRSVVCRTLALLALALPATLPHGALVVCVGIDGTAALEIAHQEGACEHTSDHVHDGPADHDHWQDASGRQHDDAQCTDHEHRCSDQAVSMDMVRSPEHRDLLAPRAAVASLATSWLTAPWRPAVERPPHVQRCPIVPPYHAKTVVMRT